FRQPNGPRDTRTQSGSDLPRRGGRLPPEPYETTLGQRDRGEPKIPADVPAALHPTSPRRSRPGKGRDRKLPGSNAAPARSRLARGRPGTFNLSLVACLVLQDHGEIQ